MAVSFSARVRVAPDVLFRLVGDEGVLSNLNTELYLGLNPVGTRMWSVLNNAGSIQAAYDDLLQEYEVEPERLRADLEEFIDQLLGQQLIEAVPRRRGFRTGVSGIVGMLNLDGSPVDGRLLARYDGIPAFRGPDRQRVRCGGQCRLRSCAAEITEESERRSSPSRSTADAGLSRTRASMLGRTSSLSSAHDGRGTHVRAPPMRN